MEIQSSEKKKTGFFDSLKESQSTDEFIKGLWRENPVFVQVLGMCPVLAVTNSAENALAMGLATLFVLLKIYYLPFRRAC